MNVISRRIHGNFTLRNVKFVRGARKGVEGHRDSSDATSTEDELQSMDDRRTVRRNPMDIQMLDASLHRQLFGETVRKCNDEDNIRRSVDHLKKHGLWGRETSLLPEVVGLELPRLRGANLDEHFRRLAVEQSDAYRALVQSLASATIPLPPKVWVFEVGWTKYNADGSSEAVLYPPDEALVFDVEVLVLEGDAPTLATAVSKTSWYSWCSRQLFDHLKPSDVALRLHTHNLIPLETTSTDSTPPLRDELMQKRVVVGHNVSYDRARIKEQYFVQGTKMRFLDTMSLHIACSGLTGLQRALLISETTGSKRKKVEEAKAKVRGPPMTRWMTIGSMNNLADVYRLYCKSGSPLNKEERSTFVTGTIADVRRKFQQLMSYCATDVVATHEILHVLLPIFFRRFPHPVTFAGMLEMSCTYLPVNHNWERYMSNARAAFGDLERELKRHLMRLANDACELQNDKKYQDDPWLWNLNWKSVKPRQKLRAKLSSTTEDSNFGGVDESKAVKATSSATASYPAWYWGLVPKNVDQGNDLGIIEPSLVSAQMQITPKLLRMTWDGFPLHYSKKNGWGYLVPGKKLDEQVAVGFEKFPLEAVKRVCSDDTQVVISEVQANGNLDSLWARIVDGVAEPEEESRLWELMMADRDQKNLKKKRVKKSATMESGDHHGIGPFDDEDIPGCYFYKLPHKDGPENRVGNPLAKNFLSKIEDGTLRSSAGEKADYALKLGKMISYWRNAHKRIESQMVVWLNECELPVELRSSEKYSLNEQYGAILPKLITAGTVTRRAVEPTWLTASNAYADRVGSELKAMVQAFPGYHFVGADVDSQELWIAAVLGDAHFGRIHGCTAFGWMTLQGKKADGTDMHSRTASTVGITRDQAKVMNYGRIYGAGQTFASRLIMQFNHRLTNEEAKVKAHTMYAATKGVRGYVLNDVGKHIWESLDGNQKTAPNNEVTLTRRTMLNLLRRPYEDYCDLEIENVASKTVWVGGTESAMFNKLEEIASCLEPKTPVLDCRISRALEVAYVLDNFMTSRVNWVVQSSAVDYLHLMLVSMRWLLDAYNIDGRFSISIHDEVRYHVKSEDRFRAALALQITNLFTRALFAFKLGMDDLPQSVAFFSAVDIDTVLRKEVHDDCKTPSNPQGLQAGYDIPPGIALDVYAIVKMTKGKLTK